MHLLDHIRNCPDLQLFYHMVDNFCKHELNPRQYEADGRIPREIWLKLGKAGLNGVTVPIEYGGLGLSLAHHLIAMTVISAYSPSLGLSYGAHSNLCIHQLAKHGSEQQKKTFLPKLISGENIGALAMSEVDAGSDALNLRLKAERVSENFCLNGSKMWITNAPSADIIITYARTGKNITAFIVQKSETCYSAQAIDKLGMRASETSELVFSNCLVSSQNILGDLDKGKYILMDGLSCERLILTGGPLGIMQACLSQMHEYMNLRQQFGKKIADFQLMQAKMADCYTKFSATAAWAVNLSRSKQTNYYDPTALLLFASENATYIANQAVQTLGGNGYSEDFDVAKYYRDAKLYEIGAGTNEIRRTLVGRYILNET